MPRGTKTQKTIKEDRKIKVFYNEEVLDQPLPEIINLEELKYQGGKLKDLNLNEGRKLDNIEEGAMNLANHTSDELPEGTVHLYDDIDASNRAKAGLTAEGFVQKVIRGANITGTPAVGVNVTNQYIGYYNGSTWPVYIANNGLFMFQGNSGNYITWNGSVLNIRGQLNADDIAAGTLTGRTIRTGTGNRVELFRSDDPNYPNQLRWVNSSGYLMASIKMSGWVSGATFDIETFYADYVRILSDLGITGHCFPTVAGYDLGGSSNKWRNLYLSGNIYINGVVDGVDISAHASNPSAHHTKTAYSSEITVNSNWQMNNYEINNLSFLRFSSSYGQIYWGTARAVDMMNTWDPLPSGTTGWHRWDMRVDMIPCADNAGQIGYDSRRWQKVRAVTITSGDLIFENKFRITEEGENALAIYNSKGKKILIIDDEGNIKKINT